MVDHLETELELELRKQTLEARAIVQRLLDICDGHHCAVVGAAGIALAATAYIRGGYSREEFLRNAAASFDRNAST